MVISRLYIVVFITFTYKLQTTIYNLLYMQYANKSK